MDSGSVPSGERFSSSFLLHSCKRTCGFAKFLKCSFALEKEVPAQDALWFRVPPGTSLLVSRADFRRTAYSHKGKASGFLVKMHSASRNIIPFEVVMPVSVSPYRQHPSSAGSPHFRQGTAYSASNPEPRVQASSISSPGEQSVYANRRSPIQFAVRVLNPDSFSSGEEHFSIRFKSKSTYHDKVSIK